MKINDLLQNIKKFDKEKLHKYIIMFLYYSCVMFFIIWARDFYLAIESSFVIAFASVLFYVFGGGFMRASFLFILGISVLFQNHLVLNYSYPFSVIGREILLLTTETNLLEFETYLRVISVEEYLTFFVLLSIILVVFKLSPKQRNKNIPLALGLFLLLFGMWQDVGEPVYVFQKEMSENEKIFRLYNDFRFDAKDISKIDVQTCILVIGETHRQDYFDKYAYSSKYTPHLMEAKRKGNLYDFTDTTSGFYYTTGSVPIILTRKPVECDTRFYEEKSIISAFKEAGYYTYTISYTKKTQPQDDAMNLLFLESDEYINHSETSGTVDDIGMLPQIKEILNDKTKAKKLIVVKMIGAHYLYEDRYPDNFEIFKPSFKSVPNRGEAMSDRTLLTNSYKNALIYSVTFLDKLKELVDYQEEPTLMTFISDHGSTLYDDDISKFVGRAKGSYHIAFFITGNDVFWNNTSINKKRNLRLNRNAKLTQEYFLETYLSLAKISYFDPRPNFDITSYQFVPSKERNVWTQEGFESYEILASEKTIR